MKIKAHFYYNSHEVTYHGPTPSKGDRVVLTSPSHPEEPLVYEVDMVTHHVIDGQVNEVTILLRR